MHGTKEAVVEQTIGSRVQNYQDRLNQKLIPKPSNCQVCGHAGRLSWHGSYERRLLSMTQIYTLGIRRLFCALCRHSFALLPNFVMKFCHYAKETILSAVRMLRIHTYEAVAGRFMAQDQRCMSTLTLYLWRRKFG